LFCFQIFHVAPKMTINDQKDLTKYTYETNKKLKNLVMLLYVDEPFEHDFSTLVTLNTTCVNLRQVHAIHILQNVNYMNSYNCVSFF
jgi:hypothetical protein